MNRKVKNVLLIVVVSLFVGFGSAILKSPKPPTPTPAPSTATAATATATPTATLALNPTPTATTTKLVADCHGWETHTTMVNVNHQLVTLDGVEVEREGTATISEIAILRGNDVTVVVDPGSKGIFATSDATIWGDCGDGFVLLSTSTSFVRVEESNGTVTLRWIFDTEATTITAAPAAAP